MNRGGIVELFLTRTLLAIRKKSTEASFWEVKGCFTLLAYASLAASRTLFLTITSLPEPYFRFKRFILLVQTIDFYELWQQYKQLKAMEMSEALSDIYNEGYIHQFPPEPTHKSH